MPNTIRIAGAQIPVKSNSISDNLSEIKKALDWAAENKVDILQTPECALSGYDPNHWLFRKDDADDILLSDALTEVEEYQKKLGVGLNLGTCCQSEEYAGTIARNQIRHYSKTGKLYSITSKTLLVAMDSPCISNDYPIQKWRLPPEYNPPSRFGFCSLICNDMWSYTLHLSDTKSMNRSLMELICSQSPDLIFHATNGFKFDSEVIEKGAQHLISIRDNVFENWHQGWLSMAAFSGMSYILTVDSCTHWFWDGNEETVNKTKSASTSGVLNPLGEWEVQAPRYGRHYFHYDLDMEAKDKNLKLLYEEASGKLLSLVGNPQKHYSR